jgi:hypothetical protein
MDFEWVLQQVFKTIQTHLSKEYGEPEQKFNSRNVKEISYTDSPLVVIEVSFNTKRFTDFDAIRLFMSRYQGEQDSLECTSLKDTKKIKVTTATELTDSCVISAVDSLIKGEFKKKLHYLFHCSRWYFKTYQAGWKNLLYTFENTTGPNSTSAVIFRKNKTLSFFLRIQTTETGIFKIQAYNGSALIEEKSIEKCIQDTVKEAFDSLIIDHGELLIAAEHVDEMAHVVVAVSPAQSKAILHTMDRLVHLL